MLHPVPAIWLSDLEAGLGVDILEGLVELGVIDACRFPDI